MGLTLDHRKQAIRSRAMIVAGSLLRRYFPKGSDFGKVTQETLAAAVKKLNHRPRKCLGYRTPHEVFLEAKRGALGM